MKSNRLKVRIISVTVKQVEYYLDRFLSTNFLYKRLVENFEKLLTIKKLNKEAIKYLTQLSIRIVVKHSSKYFESTLDTLPNILNPILNDLEQVVDLNIYILIKYLKYIDEIEETQLLKLELVTVDKIENSEIQVSELNYLLTAILLTNQFGEIDKNLIEYIFENNKSIVLSHAEQKSFYATLFNQTRSPRGDGSNRRLTHKNEINKMYLSTEQLQDKSFKEVKILYCPICNKSFRATKNILTITDNILHFNCEHTDTIFLDYKQFSYLIEEEIAKLNFYHLTKWFNHNIKVFNRNGVYMINIHTKTEQSNIPVTKFLMNQTYFSKYVTKIQQNQPFFVNAHCPICSKVHHVYFDENDYKDGDIFYSSYQNVIKQDKYKYLFNCEHDAPYENYKSFYIYTNESYKDLELLEEYTEFKHIALDDFYKIHALELCFNYKKVSIDGKEMIKRFLTSESFEIIDLSTFYEY